MSDTPRGHDEDDAPTSRIGSGRSDYDRADEPVTGAPAGAADASDDSARGSSDASHAPWTSTGAGTTTGSTGSTPGDAGTTPGDARTTQTETAQSGTAQTGAERRGTAQGETTQTEAARSGAAQGGTAQSGSESAAARRGARSGPGRGARWRGMLGFGPVAAADERQRRRRRWFVAGISVGAVIIVVALCAGALSIASSIDGVRDRAADAREARRLRESDCLELESRLNRLVPPGATTGPKQRATAIRDENAAVRLYVTQLHSQREEDGWRQLLDARTVFADALDRQASARTPAFYVAPETSDGVSVAAELSRWSPEPCGGPIRRLAAPEL